MVISKAPTVKDYLAELPDDRRASVEKVREVILKNLDKVYEEGMLYGMIGYYVPLSYYPPGYHTGPNQPLSFAGLASQKNHLSLYMMGLYCGCIEGSEETALYKWFRGAWAKSGKKLDMGKACIRFKKAEDLPLDVVGEAIARLPAKTYVGHYDRIMKQMAAAKKKRK